MDKKYSSVIVINCNLFYKLNLVVTKRLIQGKLSDNCKKLHKFLAFNLYIYNLQMNFVSLCKLNFKEQIEKHNCSTNLSRDIFNRNLFIYQLVVPAKP